MFSKSDNLRGAALMSGSMAAFTINDSFIRGLLGDVHLYQAIFMRGVLTVVLVMLVVTRFVGPVRLRFPTRDWILVVIRSVAEAAAAFTFLTAISKMPFANATAILQTLPLSITIVGAVVFGDPLGWRRIVAILVGFFGVLLIVKPGTDLFDVNALWAVAGMACVTVRDSVVRAMSSAVPTATVTILATLTVTLSAGFAASTVEWHPLDALGIVKLLGTAGFVVVGYVLSILVMKVGEISYVSLFRYTALVWALLIGLVFFGEWPDGWALLGAGIIAATGIYTALRESRMARRVARQSAGVAKG